MRALFEAPTPTEMAELIAEHRGELERRSGCQRGESRRSLPDWIVPLQREGTGQPVFVFPAGAGRVWHVTMDGQVATRVGRDHPFWGFQRDDANQDHQRSDEVETLATAVRDVDAPHPGQRAIPAVCALSGRIPGVGNGQAASRPGRGDRRHALLRGPAPSRFRGTAKGAEPGADHHSRRIWPRTCRNRFRSISPCSCRKAGTRASDRRHGHRSLVAPWRRSSCRATPHGSSSMRSTALGRS